MPPPARRSDGESHPVTNRAQLPVSFRPVAAVRALPGGFAGVALLASGRISPRIELSGTIRGSEAIRRRRGARPGNRLGLEACRIRTAERPLIPGRTNIENVQHPRRYLRYWLSSIGDVLYHDADRGGGRLALVVGHRVRETIRPRKPFVRLIADRVVSVDQHRTVCTLRDAHEP